ncbi:FAD dependent oxidoreductase-domain-containing protein [Paraphoma chrysanthemicola]|uniref:FAD dependent oxidoreductase-domain-containing protein n=1 Tax=Paraphoma chrysanthemicola TaxID=798071 RepID=A0A8K0RG77_9PLEO|nr:FAD dependent oxidoreductase-domain-containing protein [Paraphoma chrysanthemicola]
MLSSLIDVLVACALIPAVQSTAIPRSSRLLNRGNIEQAVITPQGFPVPNPTESYWQVPEHRIANLRSTEELPTDHTFDYVIIGSGVSGAAIAMKLLDRNPELSVLMLEARKAASGASGRNGGHCRPGMWKSIKTWTEKYGEDEAVRLQKMEQDCVNDVRDFVRTNNVSSGFQDVETADLYWTKEAFDNAVKVWGFQQELEQRRPDEVAKNNRTVYSGQAARDYWGWPEILGAITFYASTQNPYLTVCAILERALKHDLNLQTNTLALNLKQLPNPAANGAKWTVTTDRGTVQAKQVVLATNGFTNAIHPGFASTGYITPDRSQVAAVHPSAETSNNTVFQRSASYPDLHSGNNYIVVRAPGDLGEGDVIYGGGKQFSPTREMGITDDSVINEDIALHLHRVGRTVYGYKNWGETTTVLKDWTGITCVSKDGLPVIGAVPGEDGLWAQVCMNGHGMAWAFRSAEALVQMMEVGEKPEWFPRAFDIERAFE